MPAETLPAAPAPAGTSTAAPPKSADSSVPGDKIAHADVVDASTTVDQIADAAEQASAAPKTQSQSPVEAPKPEEKPLVLSEEERPVPEVLQNIVNFRDVGKNYNGDIGSKALKEGIFFRSGRLDDATTKDLELLTELYHIRTVIDLRSETEGKMGDDLVNTFPASAINETKIYELLGPMRDPPASTGEPIDAVGPTNVDGASESPAPHPQKSTSSTNVTKPTHKGEVPVTRKVEKGKENGRVTYYVNFAGKKFRRHAVWKPLKTSTKIKCICYLLTHQKPRVVSVVGSESIQPHGLLGLNLAFLHHSGTELASVLRLMSHPSHYPLLVHCTQGKDRTGLVCALALHIAGAHDAEIVKDYERTNEGLKRQRDVMVEEMRKTGLSEEFVDAPPECMVGVLAYIRKTWGSVEGYLESIGFEEVEQRRLKACLVGLDVDDFGGDDEGEAVVAK